jgi:hypothetical protein
MISDGENTKITAGYQQHNSGLTAGYQRQIPLFFRIPKAIVARQSPFIPTRQGPALHRHHYENINTEIRN